MPRRALVIALAVVSASLTSCAESITAPQQPTVAPSAPHPDMVEKTLCKGGYILSEGRCV